MNPHMVFGDGHGTCFVPPTPTPEVIWEYFTSNMNLSVLNCVCGLDKAKTIELLSWVYRNQPAPQVLDFISLINQ